MTETLASRVRRLVSGTVNAIVDSVESAAPEMVMEEAIREMGRAADEVRDELARVMTRQHQATRRLATEDGRHGELTEQIRLAVAEKRDDLAEAGVERLLDIEAQIPLLQQAIAETRAEQAELEGYIAALQARRREMEFELKEFRAANAAAGHAVSADGERPANRSTAARRASRADEAFGRVMNGAGGFSGAAAAADSKSSAMRHELEMLSRRNRIKERLAELKSQS